MNSLAVQKRGAELIERQKFVAAIRRCPGRPCARRLAFASVVVSLLVTLPALARTAPSGTKPARIVPATAGTETRQSPYVRMNRQHLEALANGPAAADPHAVQRPPKLAGQVQRR